VETAAAVNTRRPRRVGGFHLDASVARSERSLAVRCGDDPIHRRPVCRPLARPRRAEPAPASQLHPACRTGAAPPKFHWARLWLRVALHRSTRFGPPSSSLGCRPSFRRALQPCQPWPGWLSSSSRPAAGPPRLGRTAQPRQTARLIRTDWPTPERPARTGPPSPGSGPDARVYLHARPASTPAAGPRARQDGDAEPGKPLGPLTLAGRRR
jgi:hypothetical protein